MIQNKSDEKKIQAAQNMIQHKIRRPLLYITFAFAVPVVIGYYAGMKVLAASAAMCVLIIFVFGSRGYRHAAVIWIILAAYLCGCANFALHDALQTEPAADEGSVCEIKGKVLQINEKENEDGTCRTQYRVEVHETDGKMHGAYDIIAVQYREGAASASETEKASETVNSAAAEKNGYEAVPGDIVLIKGTAEKPLGRRNPGCFDYSLYLKSIGITGVLKADSVYAYEKNGRNSLTGKLYVMREEFLAELEGKGGEEAAAMTGAILFGKKDSMDEDVLEEFQKNGTAHVLAVSGLHIGMIYALIARLWRWRKGKFYFAVVMSFFFCYAVLASFSPSVTRAVIMIGLHQLAVLTGKRYDLFSAAFFTAAVMMLANPMCVFNTGFQMSFLAVLTMMLVTPAIDRLYKGIFTASISVQAGLMPYTAYVFNYFSPGAVLVNIPVIFLTGIIVPAGLSAMLLSVTASASAGGAAGEAASAVPAEFICAALFSLSDTLFAVTADVMAGLCRMLVKLNSITAADGVTVFTVTSPPIALTAFYYLAMLAFVSEEGRLFIKRKGKKIIVVMLAAVIAASAGFGKMCGNGFGTADVTFVDVGQGDCIHFRSEDGGNYFTDGGGSINYNVGKKVLKPYLLKNGVRKLDGVFLTHLHTDHYKGIAELCREGMVRRLYLYEGNRINEEEILKDTGLEHDNLIYLYKGQTVRLSADTTVDILWPERKTEKKYKEMQEREEDENLSSLIMKINLGEASVLATGDVNEECLNQIEEVWKGGISCDILKVPHHGSKYSYSDEFVKQASPGYAVFQVGKNNFGHPNDGVVENYRQNGIMIYRNDKDGAVAFDFPDDRKTGDGEADVFTVIKRKDN